MTTEREPKVLGHVSHSTGSWRKGWECTAKYVGLGSCDSTCKSKDHAALFAVGKFLPGTKDFIDEGTGTCANPAHFAHQVWSWQKIVNSPEHRGEYGQWDDPHFLVVAQNEPIFEMKSGTVVNLAGADVLRRTAIKQIEYWRTIKP